MSSSGFQTPWTDFFLRNLLLQRTHQHWKSNPMGSILGVCDNQKYFTSPLIWTLLKISSYASNKDSNESIPPTLPCRQSYYKGESEPLRVTEEHRQREKVLDKQPTLASSLPVLWV